MSWTEFKRELDQAIGDNDVEKAVEILGNVFLKKLRESGIESDIEDLGVFITYWESLVACKVGLYVTLKLIGGVK